MTIVIFLAKQGDTPPLFTRVADIIILSDNTVFTNLNCVEGMSTQYRGYSTTPSSYEVLDLTDSLFLSHDDDLLGGGVGSLPLAGGLNRLPCVPKSCFGCVS